MPNPPHVTPAVAERRRWESAMRPLLGDPPGGLWRRHSDAVNGALIARWLAVGAEGDLLKTDLYDEAMGDGLYPLLEARARRIAGIDIVMSVLSTAVARYPALRAAAADVRCLPFAAASFDVVVSNSTLDHFGARGDILDALVGIHRVLRPGGRLVLTMDNLRHPAVALRNALPFAALRQLGLVDYPVGATLGPRGIARMLRHAGFEVIESVALLHCPRALAVHKARRLERTGASANGERFLRRLSRWEMLARAPTRFLTGHYVGVLARKP